VRISLHRVIEPGVVGMEANHYLLVAAQHAGVDGRVVASKVDDELRIARHRRRSGRG
jgi:hypothetical protein